MANDVIDNDIVIDVSDITDVVIVDDSVIDDNDVTNVAEGSVMDNSVPDVSDVDCITMMTVSLILLMASLMLLC